jgi:dGTPase
MNVAPDHAGHTDAAPAHPDATRDHAEPLSLLFTPWELDRRRILNCTAFRRMEHKTQVFAPALHDHFRTRLTHTLEVADIARTLARIISANAELAEAISLAHDLGHPPFGHAGEAALNDLMRDHGGFNHNTHSLRVVEYLEHPIPAFRGLNLTRAVRDGLRSHETRYDRPDGSVGYASGSAAGASDGAASVEANIASLADRIAYDLHDLEDAIGAGLIAAENLDSVEWWRLAKESLPTRERTLPIHAVRRPILDAMLLQILHDVTDSAIRSRKKTFSPPDPCAAAMTMITLSPQWTERFESLEAFLSLRVYKHPDVAALDEAGRRMITALFHSYRDDPRAMPERYADRIPKQGVERVVCDYIAGMTDRFADAEHANLMDNRRTV